MNQPLTEPLSILGLLAGDMPGLEWEMHDDLCDCIYQRVGFWSNPYLAETHKIRLCCVWARLREMWPDLFQDIPAYFDLNTRRYIEEAAEWNGEDDMPRAVWYRQLAHRTGKPLAEVRAKYADQEPPRGVKRAYKGTAISIKGGR